MNFKALQSLLPDVIRIGKHAGDILMTYRQSGELNVQIKEDKSPVTAADFASHNYIVDALASLTPDIPIVSEENPVQPDLSDNEIYWTVDPLDGTKNFIDGNNIFYVKIALMRGNTPILGFVYSPSHDISYYSWEGGKSYKQEGAFNPKVIKANQNVAPEDISLIQYKSVNVTDAFNNAGDLLRQRGLDITKIKDAVTNDMCSYLQIAEGNGDVYINCGQRADLIDGNGYSWDYAADWLILQNAGGVMVDLQTGKEVTFDAPAERMNAMVGLGDRNFGKTLFPKL